MRYSQKDLQHYQGGFSILEVTVAALVLIISLTGIVELQNQSSIVQRKAEQQVLAAEIATFVMDRLAIVDYDSPLLEDVDFTNPPLCAKADVTSCAFDHGTVAELDQVFDAWDTVTNKRPVVVDVTSDGIPFVWYEGYRFFVAWSITPDTPFLGSIQYSLHVRYEPFNGALTFSSVSDFRMETGL